MLLFTHSSTKNSDNLKKKKRKRKKFQKTFGKSLKILRLIASTPAIPFPLPEIAFMGHISSLIILFNSMKH